MKHEGVRFEDRSWMYGSRRLSVNEVVDLLDCSRTQARRIISGERRIAPFVQGVLDEYCAGRKSREESCIALRFFCAAPRRRDGDVRFEDGVVLELKHERESLVTR
jgi:hypothetical protein